MKFGENDIYNGLKNRIFGKEKKKGKRDNTKRM